MPAILSCPREAAYYVYISIRSGVAHPGYEEELRGGTTDQLNQGPAKSGKQLPAFMGCPSPKTVWMTMIIHANWCCYCWNETHSKYTRKLLDRYMKFTMVSARAENRLLSHTKRVCHIYVCTNHKWDTCWELVKYQEHCSYWLRNKNKGR